MYDDVNACPECGTTFERDGLCYSCNKERIERERYLLRDYFEDTYAQEEFDRSFEKVQPKNTQ